MKTRTILAVVAVALLAAAPQVSASKGRQGSAGAKKPTGTEVRKNAQLGDKNRIKLARSLLRTRLGKAKRAAILKAHAVGDGEIGKDGVRPAGINRDGTSNFTVSQLRRKITILKRAGFKRAQIRTLLDHGVTGREIDALLDQILMLQLGNAGNSLANMFIEDAARYGGGERTAESRTWHIRGAHRKFRGPKNDGSIIVMFSDNSGAYIHPDGFVTPMGKDISHEVSQWEEIKD
ncbi:MAG TPA: hypothetical protein VFU21_21590 [Kofleriaceae bacterium]|nr:hypothetical protein [Kofleriaceae bacterium]